MGPEPIRCWPTSDPLYIAYHDEEWGRPVRDERGLYERLCLEGFQSGLAWITILRKREAFRRAFAGFDPERVARFGERDIERLLGDAGIVRHRGKIEAAIANARATLELREAEAPLEKLMWEYLDHAWRAGAPPGGHSGDIHRHDVWRSLSRQRDGACRHRNRLCSAAPRTEWEASGLAAAATERYLHVAGATSHAALPAARIRGDRDGRESVADRTAPRPGPRTQETPRTGTRPRETPRIGPGTREEPRPDRPSRAQGSQARAPHPSGTGTQGGPASALPWPRRSRSG